MGDTLNLATQIRQAELLKGEIICRAGNLYKSMANGEEIREITEMIGDMILDLYLLGDKVGILPSAVDASIIAKIKTDVAMDEKVTKHFMSGRKQGKGF